MSAIARAQIRQPAVCGSFYPAHTGRLERTLAELLESDRSHAGDEPAPRALIVPHAGYVYSGQAAAAAYRKLITAADSVRRVVILGPPHRVPVPGICSTDHAFFRTPLGQVRLDRAEIDALAAAGQIEIDNEAHAQEHAIEVHLPFLQTVLQDFTIIPLLVGTADTTRVARLLESWWQDDGTLIVVSTDLSHFLDYDTAQRRDAETDRHIRALESSILGPEDACGCRAVNGLLELAARQGARINRLALCNSGDTAGPADRVVGYASYALHVDDGHAPALKGQGARAVPDTGRAGHESLLEPLAELAAHEIAVALHERRRRDIPLPREADAIGASFVTLHRDGQLRGCIGTVEAHRSLGEDVQQNARAAAFKDPRFPPLELSELSTTTLEISLLSPRQEVVFTSDDELFELLRPGIDGVVLSYRGLRSIYLPEVWLQLPDPSVFLESLRRKGGIPDDVPLTGLTVERYTSLHSEPVGIPTLLKRA